MRSAGAIVKPLAHLRQFWHRLNMAKDAADKERIKAERLGEALRANLRRRKAPAQAKATDKSEAPGQE